MKKIILVVLLTFMTAALLGCDQRNPIQSDHQSANPPDESEIQKVNLDRWLGEYEWGTGENNKVYMLSIYKEEDTYLARMLITGRMLEVRLNALVEGTEYNIAVIFDSFIIVGDRPESDDTFPPYFGGDEWGELKEGDVLFRLSGKEFLGTEWGAIPTPVVKAFERVPYYGGT